MKKYSLRRHYKYNRRNKRSPRSRGIFRDVINEWLYPNATITTSNGLLYAGLLSVFVLPLMMIKPLPEIQPGEAPPGLPQPGSTSGGGRMDDIENVFLGEALNLVPEGLKAVSIFPPFSTERSVSAVAAVYSESPVANRRRGKRSILNMMASFEENLFCLKPRLASHFRGKRQARTNSLDDCFKDLEEPLYAYTVKLYLKEEEPCLLRSCLKHLNQTSSKPRILRRSNEINVIGDPDCRVKNICG